MFEKVRQSTQRGARTARTLDLLVACATEGQ